MLSICDLLPPEQYVIVWFSSFSKNFVQVSGTSRLQQCDRSMIRWMCHVKWSEQVSSVSLLEKLMIPSITSQLSQNCLHWFGHVKRDGISIVLCLTKLLENVLQVDQRKLGPKRLRKILVIGICWYLLKTDMSRDPQCGKSCSLVTHTL